MKVCTIGCGSFARLCHGPAQRRLAASAPDVTLAACCDSDPARAFEFCGAFGFGRHYVDARRMLLAEKPDAVVLAVPPVATCGAASEVLAMGFPVLIEKPPGLDRLELATLIAAGKKGGVGAQVAFNRHYMPVMLKAREIMAGAFGPGDLRRLEYDMNRIDRWDPDFSTTAVHAVDGALFLAGSPFRAAEISFETRRRGQLEATDVTVSAEFRTGARAVVKVRPVSPTNSDAARIDAGVQSLELAIPVSPQTEYDGRVEHWQNGALVTSFSDRGLGAVARLGVLGETEAFLNSVRTGGPFAPSLEDCLQQVALMEAIRSRRAGPVHFGERAG